MQMPIKKFAAYLIISIILTLGLSISLQSLLAAWTAPTASPPGDNIYAPIYATSSVKQWINKDVTGGSLGIAGNFSVIGDSSFAGNVGIGTANAGTNKLEVDPDGVANNGDEFVIDASGNVGINDASPDSIFEVNPDGIEDNADEFFVDASGNAHAVGFIYTSDRALKTDIHPITNALDKVLQLAGVSFKWKNTGEDSLGLIAQDVEKVFPELVHTSESTGLKSVEYGNLVAPLIEAIKAQQVRIQELEKEIEELKLNK